MDRVAKLALAITLLTVISFSCSSNEAAVASACNNWRDTLAFPKQPFCTVTLFRLDSAVKTTALYNGETRDDTNVVVRVGGPGNSFVGADGMPKTKQHKAYQLDSLQIKRLESFLVQQPCGEGKHADKACAPTYKNVFVFYDQQKQPVAQMHVCFNCELSVFIPYVDYMCDFDNVVNYKALKEFTDGICHTGN